MKKIFYTVFGIIILASVIWGGIFFWHNLRGIGPALRNPPEDIAKLIGRGSNSTGMPLVLPQGFSISVFAKDLAGARVMAFDREGNLWVSQTGKGVITMLEIRDGKVVRQRDILTGLRRPHGLAFDADPSQGSILYFAEEDKISRVAVGSADGTIGKPEKIADLPSGGGHFTRSIGFGPDKRLYVSIGSSCNVCREEDPRRAAIYSLSKDGSDFKLFAKGLRNSVFFIWHPDTKKMWATEMGRDLLGDDTPPDEINIIKEGANHGWPICYGKNIHDADFDKNTYIRNPCMEPFETPSFIDIPAHSAPLGLAFIPRDLVWPEEYQGDLLVAYHGSWNRSTPTGYKIVRMTFNERGEYEGVEDFITGWLGASKDDALGRPVDLVMGRDKALYVSDDKAGVIYKVTHPGK